MITSSLQNGMIFHMIRCDVCGRPVTEYTLVVVSVQTTEPFVDPNEETLIVHGGDCFWSVYERERARGRLLAPTRLDITLMQFLAGMGTSVPEAIKGMIGGDKRTYKRLRARRNAFDKVVERVRRSGVAVTVTEIASAECLKRQTVLKELAKAMAMGWIRNVSGPGLEGRYIWEAADEEEITI